MTTNTLHPISMEDYFPHPGFKTKPAVHVGSQTAEFIHNNAEEQAWEGFCLAAASGNDVAVVRNFDESYLQYWKSLMGNPDIINIKNSDPGKYLTEVLLESPSLLNEIKQKMNKDSQLMVFFPTELEQQLAEKVDIPLHGSSSISTTFGTKSGIRRLAQEANIAMPPGFICSTYEEVEEAVKRLEKQYDHLVIKHDLSFGGYFSKKINSQEKVDIKAIVDEISNGNFSNSNQDIVVEAWLSSSASLCAHIEIPQHGNPVVCAGWQQVIDADGITYIGGGPLMISHSALTSFLESSQKLAQILKKQGAVGSFGPDFIVTQDEQGNDQAILIELNARVPFTAFPLEIVKQIKGSIGEGFYGRHIRLSHSINVSEIFTVLREENLLITHKDAHAKGVVPYNVGLLPWKLFDIVAMADTWEETRTIADRVQDIFS